MSYRADKLVIDTHTDTQTQTMTIPEGQKKKIHVHLFNMQLICKRYTVQFDIKWPMNLTEMLAVIGIEDMESLVRLGYPRDNLR